MTDVDIITIESKDQLKEAVSRRPIFVLFCTVDGRDAVNASAQEEFEAAAERYNTSKRTFARIAGEKFKTELKEIGVDMGQEPYPKFAILVNGEVRIADDVVDVDLPEANWIEKLSAKSPVWRKDSSPAGNQY